MLQPLVLDVDSPGNNKSGPSFIGVGTPKAGTSWWFELLMQHPDIQANQFGVKETCYFCHSWPEIEDERFVQNYKNGFVRTHSHTQIGEWSTLYFCHPFALERLVKTFPNAKYLVTFRSPVTTFYSWLNQLLRNRAKLMIQDSQEARFMYLNYDAIPSLYSQICQFPARLQWLKKSVGEKLLCLQYEQNVSSVQSQFSKCLSHLEVKPFTVKNAETLVNKADENLLKDVVIPKETVKALQKVGKELLEMCPDFNTSLWD